MLGTTTEQSFEGLVPMEAVRLLPRLSNIGSKSRSAPYMLHIVVV